MDTSTRKPIDTEQAEVAARLKALFQKNTTLSQQEFGLLYDIGTQGAVWQYLNGVRPLNISAALRFARRLNCHVSDFSPRLGAELASGGTLDPIRQVVDALPVEDRQQIVDFLKFKVSASNLLAAEKVSSYITMLDNIARDMTRRKENDAG